MPGKHRKKINPRTDTGITVDQLREKLRPPSDNDEDPEDFPAVHGSLDDDNDD